MPLGDGLMINDTIKSLTQPEQECLLSIFWTITPLPAIAGFYKLDYQTFLDTANVLIKEELIRESDNPYFLFDLTDYGRLCAEALYKMMATIYP